MPSRYSSDADGTFIIDGAYLTISAVFDNPGDSGLNINTVRLGSAVIGLADYTRRKRGKNSG